MDFLQMPEEGHQNFITSNTSTCNPNRKTKNSGAPLRAFEEHPFFSINIGDIYFMKM